MVERDIGEQLDAIAVASGGRLVAVAPSGRAETRRNACAAPGIRARPRAPGLTYTMPELPSSTRLSPSATDSIRWSTPTTVGISKARASSAACEVVPPDSSAIPTRFSCETSVSCESVSSSATRMVDLRTDCAVVLAHMAQQAMADVAEVGGALTQVAVGHRQQLRAQARRSPGTARSPPRSRRRRCRGYGRRTRRPAGSFLWASKILSSDSGISGAIRCLNRVEFGERAHERLFQPLVLARGCRARAGCDRSC